MIGEPLHFTVPAQSDMATGTQHIDRACRRFALVVLFRRKPEQARRGSLKERAIGKPTVDARIFVRPFLGQQPINRQRAAERHHEGGRVGDASAGHQLHDVIMNGRFRDRMFEPTEAIDDVRQILFAVGAPFRGRHEPQLARGFHEPLSLLSGAGLIRLEIHRAVVVAVHAQQATRVVERLEVGAGADAGAGGEDPWAGDTVDLHEVGDVENVRRDLRVADGGDPHREVGESIGGLGLQQRAGTAPMGVDVDEPGHDVLAGDIDHGGAGRSGRGAACGHARDAPVGDDHVGITEHVSAAHRDDRRATQHDGAGHGRAWQRHLEGARRGGGCRRHGEWCPERRRRGRWPRRRSDDAHGAAARGHFGALGIRREGAGRCHERGAEWRGVGDDRATIRRPGGIGPPRRRRSETHRRLAAVGARFPEGAAAFIPGDERHPPTVGGPRRHEFPRPCGSGETARCTGGVGNPDASQRRKGDLSIGGGGLLLHTTRAHGPRGQPLREVQRRGHVQRDISRERDHGIAAVLHPQPVELAAKRRVHPAAIGGESGVGEHITRGACLELVAVHRVRQPSLGAGGERAHTEAGFPFAHGAVHERATVGGEHGLHGRQPLHHHWFGGPATHGDSHERTRGAVAAAVRARRDRGEQQARAIGGGPRAVRARRRCGDQRLRRAVAVGHESCALTARHIVAPEFRGAGAMRIGDRHDNGLPIGGPCRRQHADARKPCHRARVAAVGGGDPDIIGARFIADEHELRAVRREPWLRLKGAAGNQRRGLSAIHRYPVDVAEQLEHERAAIAGDIERDPRAFSGGEGDRPRWRRGGCLSGEAAGQQGAGQQGAGQNNARGGNGATARAHVAGCGRRTRKREDGTNVRRPHEHYERVNGGGSSACRP